MIYNFNYSSPSGFSGRGDGITNRMKIMVTNKKVTFVPFHDRINCDISIPAEDLGAFIAALQQIHNRPIFFVKDLSGRDGHYECDLPALEDLAVMEEIPWKREPLPEGETPDQDDTLFEWAESAEVGDTWAEHGFTITRIK